VEEHYYKLLGLQKGASLEEIKEAYREYVINFHPDKHGGSEFFKKRFQEIQEAYDYLTKNYQQPKPEIIDFHVDKQEIEVGEFIEVYWETKNAKNVVIKIDRGRNFKKQTYENLSNSGTKKFKTGNFEDTFKIYLVLLSFSGKYEDHAEREIIVKKKSEQKSTKPEIIDFHVSEQEIAVGEFITVYWDTKNAKKVSIYIDRGEKYDEYLDIGNSGKETIKIANFDNRFSIYLILLSFSEKYEDHVEREIIVKKKLQIKQHYPQYEEKQANNCNKTNNKNSLF